MINLSIVGIDPGASGGLAIIPPDHGLLDIKTWNFTNLSEKEIRDIIFGEVSFLNSMVFLEKVHSMPMQGTSSSFSFGQNYGFLRGLLFACFIPFEDVPAKTWQTKLGLAKSGMEKPERKRMLKAKAEQWFPRQKVTLSTADALLIAEYGYRTLYRL